MSKTFKSFLGESGSRRLHVERRPEGSNLWVSDNSWGDDYGITIAPSDAPALCLAILEAAGVPWNVDTALGRAVVELDKHVTTEAKRTAEARERAELEAEALELCNTLQVEIHGILGPNWVNVTEFPNIETKRKWLAVARRARELAKEATK